MSTAVVWWQDWEFPAWGETTVQVVFMAGLCLITYVGFHSWSGRPPSPGDVGLNSSTSPIVRRRLTAGALVGVAAMVAGAVVVVLDASPVLVVVTFLIRWPISVLAQQALFFGWLQPRLGENGARTAVVLFVLFHVAMPLALVGAIFLGALSAWLRTRTGSVRPGLAVHYLANMLFVLAFN